MAAGAVVMSLDTYNSLMDTVHLLRSPANAAHLQRSLGQAGGSASLNRCGRTSRAAGPVGSTTSIGSAIGWKGAHW